MQGCPESLEDTDHVAAGIYNAITQPNPRTGKPCPGILLPHTAVYQEGRPVALYYMQDGQVCRESNLAIDGRDIFDAMAVQKV